MVIGSVLFAAGYGKRLRPLTNAVPKAVVPILDVPLGAFALHDLVTAFPPAAVNGRAPEHDFVAPLRACIPEGWEAFVETPEPYAAGGTLAALRDRLGDSVVTRNADLLADVDMSALARAHRDSGASATLAVKPVDAGADLRIEGERVVEIYSPKEKAERAGAEFLGAAVYDRATLDLLSEERPLDLVKALLVPLVERGEVAPYLHTGYALDVGNPARYLQASLDALAEKTPSPPVPWPGRIVEVDGGRAYLGRGSRAAEDSLGPGAIVLSEARVERGARVERSVLWPREWVPSGVEVRDGVWALGGVVR